MSYELLVIGIRLDFREFMNLDGKNNHTSMSADLMLKVSFSFNYERS